MNGKKILPLIVIASMLLSLTPSIAYAAFGFTNFYAVSNGVEGSIVTNVVKGDIVAAKGSGVPAGTIVSLYWDDVTHQWNGVSGLLNSTTAASDGTFDIWFTVPEGVNGAHNIWFKDYQGNAFGPEPITVDASLSLSPSTGLPSDTISAKIYGFEKSAKITIDFGTGHVAYTTTDANSLGSASATFKVPSSATYGTYAIKAYNTTSAISVTENFVVGATITVTPTSGTVGQVVVIQGRGFTEGMKIGANNVTILNTDSSNVVPCYVTTTTPITVDSTGRIRLNIVIPQVEETGSDYSIVLTPLAASTTGKASADFEVTALASISVTPEFGPVASTITVSGVNYPKISGVEITVTVGGLTAGTVDTLSDGTFSKAFKVPALVEGDYPLVAYNTAYEITNAVYNTKTFKVGTMNLILSADSGATGTTISISGNGFGTELWNATFGSKTIIDNTGVGANGIITGSFQVPQVPVGTYTITAWDTADSIKITTSFTVTQTTTMTLGVPSAPNGYNVTLRGYGFSDDNVGQAVDFVIYNKTSTGALDFWNSMTVVQLPEGSGDCFTNSSGEFYGYWEVPASADMSQGNYWINATDASTNYAVTVPFAIGAVHASIAPRKPSFAIGETISFVIQHSFGGQKGSVADGSYVNTYDPSGALVFNGDPLNSDLWIRTGSYYTAPYSAQTAGGNQMVLPDDAPVGNWTYKWFDSSSDHALIASGTFAVIASATSTTEAEIAAIAQQVTAVATQVSGLATTVGNVATTANAASQAATSAATAAQAASAAATAASTAATAASTQAQAATAAANNAVTAANNAASAANGLTTLVYAAIGASLVAALAAIVALMQISRKIA